MINHGYLRYISLPKSGQITWDQFKNKAKLVEATKEIAALKFQEYIIRKLSEGKTHQSAKDELDKRYNEKQVKRAHAEQYQGEYKEKEKFAWYVQWRNNNLK